MGLRRLGDSTSRAGVRGSGDCAASWTSGARSSAQPTHASRLRRLGVRWALGGSRPGGVVRVPQSRSSAGTAPVHPRRPVSPQGGGDLRGTPGRSHPARTGPRRAGGASGLRRVPDLAVRLRAVAPALGVGAEVVVDHRRRGRAEPAPSLHLAHLDRRPADAAGRVTVPGLSGTDRCGHALRVAHPRPVGTTPWMGPAVEAQSRPPRRHAHHCCGARDPRRAEGATGAALWTRVLTAREVSVVAAWLEP